MPFKLQRQLLNHIHSSLTSKVDFVLKIFLRIYLTYGENIFGETRYEDNEAEENEEQRSTESNQKAKQGRLQGGGWRPCHRPGREILE